MTKFQEGKVPIIWILHPQPRIPVANEGKGTVTHNICNPWDDLYNLRIHECLIFMVSWDWYNLPTVSWLIFVGFSCKEIYTKKVPNRECVRFGHGNLFANRWSPYRVWGLGLWISTRIEDRRNCGQGDVRDLGRGGLGRGWFLNNLGHQQTKMVASWVAQRKKSHEFYCFT